MEKRLLIVDDDPDICDLVRSVAEPAGFLVEAFTSAKELLSGIGISSADIFMIDLSMPRLDGVELLSELANLGSRARIYIISGFAPGIRESAMRLGQAHGLDMRGIIPKPIRIAAIREALNAG